MGDHVITTWRDSTTDVAGKVQPEISGKGQDCA